jgi:DNA end-binding protein Ku
VYFDASYAALPEKDADKPYQVLLKALQDTHRVGIAKVTMHQREYTVFVRPRNNGITIHTMYFQNEIREVPGYGEKPKDVHVKPQEIKLAEQLIETLSEDFKPQQYHDTFQDQLRELVQAKQKGKTLTERSAPRRAKVIDMMDALKKSLRESEQGGIQPRAAGEPRSAVRSIRRAS